MRAGCNAKVASGRQCLRVADPAALRYCRRLHACCLRASLGLLLLLLLLPLPSPLLPPPLLVLLRRRLLPPLLLLLLLPLRLPPLLLLLRLLQHRARAHLFPA